MTKRKPVIAPKNVIAGAAKLSERRSKTATPSGAAMTILSKDGLPIDAFSIRPDEYDVSTWQLPHHTSAVLEDVETSVDWLLIEKATLLLSMAGDEGHRISTDPELILEAARHIASHYRRAGKSVPIALCVLI